MKRMYKVLFLAALLALAMFLQSVNAAAGVVDFALAAKIAESGAEELMRVIIRMEERPFVAAEMGAEAVQFLLKETAARTQQPVLDFLAAQQSEGKVPAFKSFWLVNLAVAEIEAGLIEQLAQIPGVAYIYEEFELRLPPVEKRDAEGQIWWWEHIACTYAPQVWEKGFRGQGITVVVTDTGVDITHPELAGALGGTPPYHEGYWAEFNDIGEKVPGSVPRDTDDHGTHVSGTIAGRSVGDRLIGMAPEVTLAHALVIPEGGGTFAQVLGGFQWVVEQRFDVVNGSFGADGQHPDIAVATDNMLAAGVVPVFSNGNNVMGAPGNTPSAIGVGAFQSSGAVASFHAGGIVEYPGYEYDEFTRIKPDISAPGVDVYSSVPGGGYAFFSGTSMSSPHTAGAAALLLSARPDLSAAEVKELLFSSTGGHEEDYGWADTPTKDSQFGWGRLNVLQAVEKLAPVGPAVEVAGQVLSDEGSVENAVVRFVGREEKIFVTDSAGNFSGELMQGWYDVTAEAPAYLPQAREVKVINKGQPVEVNFLLEAAPRGSAAGTVFAESTGLPLVGAEVAVLGTPHKVQSDENGNFEVALKEGRYALGFSKPGYFQETVENIAIIPEQTTEVSASLAFGHRTMIGRVVDTEGTPLDGAALLVAETGDSTTTAAGGNFAFDLQAGEYSIKISKTGYLTKSAAAAVEDGSVSELEIELEFNVGSLEGRVVDLDGEPVAEALVTIEQLDLQVAADENGWYGWDRIPAGTWTLVAEHLDYHGQRITVEVLFGQQTIQDIMLQPLGGDVPFKNSFDTSLEQAVWAFVNYGGTEAEWHFTQELCVSEPFSAWNGYLDEQGRRRYPPYQEVGMITSPLRLSADADPLLMTFQLRGLIWGSANQWFSVYLTDLETNIETEVYRYAELFGSEKWFEVAVDLTPFAGREVTLEFYFTSDGNTVTSDEDLWY